MKKQDLEQRLDQITTTLHAIDKTLAINTEHLAEHMRRTEIIEKDLVPVVKHVNKMQGAFGLLILLSIIATIASGFLILK
jgi:hypothetical protein